MSETDKFEEWWKKDGYHLSKGEFYESMKHIWLSAREPLLSEVTRLQKENKDLKERIRLAKIEVESPWW